jgi:hypothetical protein
LPTLVSTTVSFSRFWNRQDQLDARVAQGRVFHQELVGVVVGVEVVGQLPQVVGELVGLLASAAASTTSG